MSAFVSKRLLIVQPSWVGDFVMATPALRAWRAHLPDASISFLARPVLNDLIAGSNWADEVINWEPKGRRGRGLLSIARELRRGRFDCAVLLTNSFRSALLVRLARIPRRVGYDRDGRGWLLTDRLPVERVDGCIAVTRMVDYYGQLVEHFGAAFPGDRLELFTDADADTAIERRLETIGLAQQRPLVVISPGASFGSSKLWFPERFAALADRLAETCGAAVVVSCAPGEEAIARRIGELAQSPVPVLDDPTTSLAEFKSLIRRCDLLINNDTGPRHVAKAFGTPVVTVFGPTHQGWTDTDYELERKVAFPVDCGPCQKKVCSLEGAAHLRCLDLVTVDMVAAAAHDLLSISFRPEAG